MKKCGNILYRSPVNDLFSPRIIHLKTPSNEFLIQNAPETAMNESQDWISSDYFKITIDHRTTNTKPNRRTKIKYLNTVSASLSFSLFVKLKGEANSIRVGVFELLV